MFQNTGNLCYTTPQKGKLCSSQVITLDKIVNRVKMQSKPVTGTQFIGQRSKYYIRPDGGLEHSEEIYLSIGIRPPISLAGLRKTWETIAVSQNKGRKIETFLEIYKWKQK